MSIIICPKKALPNHIDQVLSVGRGLRRSAAAALFGTAVTVGALSSLYCAPAAAQVTETPVTIEMKLLVIAGSKDEPSLLAIKSILDQVNVPYDVLIAGTTPLTAAMLSDGAGNGRYQGIVLTTGNLAYQNASGNWASALTTAQWQLLWQYERNFKVRQATMYTMPAGLPDNYCMANPTPVTTPVNATLSTAGKTVFNYLQPTNPVAIRDSYTYLAQSSPGPNTITPLLSTAQGNPIVSICNYSDGRQNLAITADNNPNLLHTLSLGYGVINWVTKGFFIGSRQVYLNAQPDDVMLADSLWDPVRLSDETGLEYRMTGSDLNKTITWQNSVRTRNGGLFAGFALEMPYNGVGVLNGEYPDTTLKTAIYNNENEFRWISHTYTHALLNAIGSTGATTELQKNNQTANNTIGMGRYFKDSMIQPEISGLENPQFISAAYNFGIRNILCDISIPRLCLDRTSGKPNVGYYLNRNMTVSKTSGDILVIPRYAANLYYNVSTPTEWESEYNWFYAPGGMFPTFNSKQTLNDIVNREADNWLRYMLKYSNYSVMFHQTNLRFYDNQTSLLTKLIDTTLAKYAQMFKLKVQSFSQHDQATQIRDRMTFDDAGVTGKLRLGAVNTVTFTAAKSAKIPVTGITAGTSTTYGEQVQSSIPITVGVPVVVNAPTW